jgi:hypothetical protein
MRLLACLFLTFFLFTSFGGPVFSQKKVHHYIFFNLDRQRINEASFINNKAIEGAQLKYTWRELEPIKNQYDFKAIRKDLAFLDSKKKKLFIQLQDVSFGAERVNVPQYLRSDEYDDGVAPQYRIVGGDEEHAAIGGWVAKRWNPNVQNRFHQLLQALGKEFDGRIAGINLPETAVDFGETGRLSPKDFTAERYTECIIENMKVLKTAFPKSVSMQYANFMPGEWLPGSDKGYLRNVYKAARELGVGVGGPDLLPFRRGQLNHSYPLIRTSAGLVPTGIAVQEGNFAEPDPRTAKRATVQELLDFATNNLKVDYIFWCTEEPFYSKEVLPLLSQLFGVRRPGGAFTHAQDPTEY